MQNGICVFPSHCLGKHRLLRGQGARFSPLPVSMKTVRATQYRTDEQLVGPRLYLPMWVEAFGIAAEGHLRKQCGEISHSGKYGSNNSVPAVCRTPVQGAREHGVGPPSCGDETGSHCSAFETDQGSVKGVSVTYTKRE